MPCCGLHSLQPQLRLNQKGAASGDFLAKSRAHDGDPVKTLADTEIVPADVAVNINVSSSLEAIDELLAEYIEEHKIGNLDHDKGFVLGIYGCPRQFGNRMHEFMNDFAIAVVTGRNLVWEYTRQDHGPFEVGTQEECDESVRRKTWIPHRNVTKKADVYNMDTNDWQSIGCATWDELDEPLINPGKMEQYQSYALALEGSQLKGQMKSRAQILFALGPEIAFGKLWEAAFHFDEVSITRRNFKTLRAAHLIDPQGERFDKESMWVAFHMRHKSLDISKEERAVFVSTTWNQSLSFLSNRTGSCAVFLATDDEVSEAFLAPLAEEQGCTFVRADLGEVDTSWRGEHGSHTGVGALREVDLLARADILIGTAWSSFTQTIAEQMLARDPSAPFAQCQTHCGFSRMAFPKPNGNLSCGAVLSAVRPRLPEQFDKELQRTSNDQDVSLLKIDSLVDTYIQTHKAGQLDKERGFVAGVYGCPKQFGNRIHEFINSFAIAVVTDRNLAWEYTKQTTGEHSVGTQDECDELLHRHEWIPSLDRSVPASSNFVEVSSQEELACSPNEGDVLFRTHRFEEYQALALAQDGAALDDHQQARAKQLFALGPEVAFGKLMRASFSFDDALVVQPTHRVLQEAALVYANTTRMQAGSIWVAVHLRHQQETLTQDARQQFAQVVWNQTVGFLEGAQAGFGRRPCAVLMATDDEGTEDAIRPLINDAGCTLVRSDLGAEETSWSGEHGNHTGVGALRDIYLLSHADMIVGTGWSSFTQTIAELILSKNPQALFAQCNRQICITQKTAFPHPTGPNQCDL